MNQVKTKDTNQVTKVYEGRSIFGAVEQRNTTMADGKVKREIHCVPSPIARVLAYIPYMEVNKETMFILSYPENGLLNSGVNTLAVLDPGSAIMAGGDGFTGLWILADGYDQKRIDAADKILSRRKALLPVSMMSFFMITNFWMETGASGALFMLFFYAVIMMAIRTSFYYQDNPGLKFFF